MRRYAELARELIDIPVTPRQRALFITEFIPAPPDGLISDRVARNVDEARKALRLILASQTTEHAPTPATAWSRRPGSTSTTSAAPVPGRPSSTGR
jgi:hypothetical protein